MYFLGDFLSYFFALHNNVKELSQPFVIMV